MKNNKNSKFAFRLSSQDKNDLEVVSEFLQRSQADSIRFLVREKAKELQNEVGKRIKNETKSRA